MFKHREDYKKQAALRKVCLASNQKPGKVGKMPGMKGGKKPAVGGSMGKDKKNPKKKPYKKEPNLTNPGTKRTPRRGTRSLMIHVC